MSNPSFSNIDLWLFELNEGNLTPSQVEQLETFLLLHPEFDVDKDVWTNAKLSSENAVYTKKESLKRDFPFFWMMDFMSAVAVIFAMVLIGGVSSSILTSSNGLMQVGLKSNLIGFNAGNVHVLSANNYLAREGFIVYDNELKRRDDKSFIKTEDDMINQNVNSIGIAELKEISFYKEGQALVSGTMTKEQAVDANIYSVASNKITSNYHNLFKIRLSKFARKLQKMMDNPIALKNFRDPYYNIPGLSASDVNFSSAGTQLSTRVQTLSRLQWYGQENQSLSNQLNVDGYVYGMRGGVGLQINHSMYRDGGVTVADVALTYSPKFSISNTISVEPSLRFKMGNKMLNQSKMNEISTVEMDRGVTQSYFQDGATPIGDNLWYKDLGAGLMVNTKWFFVGAQVDNIFRHRDNIFENNNKDRADIHFIGSIGTDWISRKGSIRLSPFAVYQNKGQLSELWAGLNFSYNWFVIGGSYSTNQDPSATVGMKFKHFAMYYNADYSQSKLTGNRNLSHQVTLKFIGKQSQFGKRLYKL